jgi:FlaA1/EpsC-like NDP-sugar epimerase
MLECFPHEALRVNIGGTQQLARLARDYGAERFVLISTDKAVNPQGIMGASKRVCELLMHALSHQSAPGTLFTSVRFGNVLGSRGSVVPTFNRQIDTGGPVTVTDPQMTRYFMSIPEAVNLVIHAACLTKGDDLFMLRMGEMVRIVDLAERMIRMRGLVPHKDIPIKFIGMRPGEKLHEELRSPGEKEMPTTHPYIIELVSNQNGLQPVSFSDRLNWLFQEGLSQNRDPLEQLQEIIALAEAHAEHRPL